MGTTSSWRLIAALFLASSTALAASYSDVEYARPGGEPLHMDIEIPDGTGPFPAAILVHGGGFEAGDKRTYINFIFEPLTANGFAWFSINYRLSPKHRFPAATDDVAEAIRWVRKNAREYNIDPTRIALIGESAGGHLVSFVGVDRPQGADVAAVVSFYGIHDFVAFAASYGGDSAVTERFLGVRRLSAENVGQLLNASPIIHISRKPPPFLMLHGIKDEGVPFEQSVEMCAALKRHAGSCSIIDINGGHGMDHWESDPALHHYKQAMVDWLRATLR